MELWRISFQIEGGIHKDSEALQLCLPIAKSCLTSPKQLSFQMLVL